MRPMRFFLVIISITISFSLISCNLKDRSVNNSKEQTNTDEKQYDVLANDENKTISECDEENEEDINNENIITTSSNIGNADGKYTQEETGKSSYKINDNRIVINNKCGSLTIVKSDINELKMEYKKSVKVKDKEKLKEALDNIECSFKGGVITIGPKKEENSLGESKNINVTITMPNNINSLDITSSVGEINLNGNYDNLKADSNVGNIEYGGELKNGTLTSKVGNIELNLTNLSSNYSYNLNSDVGNIDIKVPKDSSINLINSNKNKIISGGVKINSDGPKFNIKSNISNVNISDR